MGWGERPEMSGPPPPCVKGVEVPELSGTRVAETTCEELWSLYLETGFLSPHKLRAIRDDGWEAKATLGIMLDDSGLDYRVLTDRHADVLRAACTVARFADREDWVMHLASLGDRPALTAVIGQLRTVVSHERWATFRFRVENQSVHRFFKASAPMQHFRICQCWRADGMPAGSAGAENIEITPVPDGHVPVALDERVRPWWSATVASSPLSGVSRIAADYRRKGLVRQRAVWTVRTSGVEVLAGILDVSPPWWNLSGLASGMEVFTLAPCAPELVARATRALVHGAQRWYERQGCHQWTLRFDDGEAGLAGEVASLGLVRLPAYAQISVPFDDAVPLATRYAQRLSLRRSALE